MTSENLTINILGTDYEIIFADEGDQELSNKDGYCDYTDKKIKVCNEFTINENSCKNIKDYRDKVVRHEIVHAYLYESGLSYASWADNEEIVDWIALQMKKISKSIVELEYKNIPVNFKEQKWEKTTL